MCGDEEEKLASSDLTLVLFALNSASQRQQGTSDAACCMADDGVFAGKIAGDAAHSKGLDPFNVREDGRSALCLITSECLRREWRGVDQRTVEDGRVRVLVDALDVVGGREAKALVGLGHEIADEDSPAAGVGEGRWNAFDQEIGDEGSVERARSNGDEVGAFNGLQRLRERSGVRGVEGEFHNAAMAGGDVGFAADE